MSHPDQRFIAIPQPDRHSGDDEQARVVHFLNALCDTCDVFMMPKDCSNCNMQKFASCQGRLPSFLYEFIDLAALHLDNESRLTGIAADSAGNGDCVQGHARLMREVESRIHELATINRQGNTLGSIRQLHQLVTVWFGKQASAIGVSGPDDVHCLEATIQ